jgi:hypothetical protein
VFALENTFTALLDFGRSSLPHACRSFPAAPALHLHYTCSAVFALENTFTTLLDFGGINSGDAEGAIRRADKGGMVSAKQLRGLVTLLEGKQSELT